MNADQEMESKKKETNANNSFTNAHLLETCDETELKGRVIRIVRRNWREYQGTLRPIHSDQKNTEKSESITITGNDRFFIPRDPRMPYVRIRTSQLNSSKLENKRILVVIDSWNQQD